MMLRFFTHLLVVLMWTIQLSMTNSFAQSHTRSKSSSDDISEAWAQRFVAQLDVPSTDRAAAIATDDSGYIYVTGNSLGGDLETPAYIATVKFSPDGVSQWEARFTGSENLFYQATAIVVDKMNNIYVTGTGIQSSSASDDYATVKYNAEGEQQWLALFNGPSDGRDNAVGLAVDDSGNVYVTGTSDEKTFSLSDLVTVKYDQAGVQQWVARYSGTGTGSFSRDEAAAIVADDSGNVYVSGTIYNSGTQEDYVTIKYNPGGHEVWVAQYNGPQGSGFDNPVAVELDDSGHVYVTGTSEGIDSRRDFATIKYNTEGNEIWAVRYNGFGDHDENAIDLEVSKSGDVYVTGTVLGDFITVKYNSAGEQQWASRYSSFNRDNEAVDLAVDSAGNVFVTGITQGSSSRKDYATVKYDADGNQLWDHIYNGPDSEDDTAVALALDAASNVYVTGTGFAEDSWQDYTTMKINSSGERQWLAHYDGPTRSEESSVFASASAIDDAGNIFVTGNSFGLGGGMDYITVKYDASGAELWNARYEALERSFHSDFKPYIAVDGAGSAYVTGFGLGSGTGFAYVTIKYNASGAEEWIARYNSSGNDSDRPAGIAVDSANNVYVIGNPATGEIATIKYDSSGNELWVARYGGSGNSRAEATAIIVDPSGNVFVGGTSIVTGKSLYLIIKYNAEGIEQWASTYEGPNGYDQLTAIAIDDSSNVYATGKSSSAESFSSIFDYGTIKLDAQGILQWVDRYNGPGDHNDVAAAIALDDSGNVFVTGKSDSSTVHPHNSDFATIKYNPAGIRQWVARYNGPGNDSDEAVALAIDGLGNIYVTGWSTVNFTMLEYATLKYNSAGEEQWIARYGLEAAGTVAMPVAIDIYPRATGENVYVSGTSGSVPVVGPNPPNAYTIVKYVQTTVAVEQGESNSQPVYWLSQNYPNPFNPTTTIRYSIARPDYVEIKVYNLAGQEVAMLISENKLAGEHQVHWRPGNLASGVYVYHLRAGELVETKKLLLVK